MRDRLLRRAEARPGRGSYGLTAAENVMLVEKLTDAHRTETLQFLNERPVHTVVMTSFILDNGLQSTLNRGEFYGCRDSAGKLEGVALIGHHTLVEARTPESLKALAFKAQSSKTAIHLVMSSGTSAEEFWSHMTIGLRDPRLVCVEKLFELSFPLAVAARTNNLRPATRAELYQVAAAQAEIAFGESGVNPMDTNPEGFVKRVARRIEQGRVFVVVDDGTLIFKADIIAETSETAYLEGIYVAPQYRGRGIGSSCLAQLSQQLLTRVSNVCLLSNTSFEDAHASYRRAGFKSTGQCTTLFA